MTRDRIIAADASQVSGADFARSLGIRVRTPAEREAEWRAEIEKFADMIERGNEWAVPCPCLADARARTGGGRQ